MSYKLLFCVVLMDNDVQVLHQNFFMLRGILDFSDDTYQLPSSIVFYFFCHCIYCWDRQFCHQF